MPFFPNPLPTSNVARYDSLAALRAAGPPSTNAGPTQYYIAITLGYDYAGDGGGMTFLWTTNNLSPGPTYQFKDDGAGLVIIPDNAPNTNGAWVAMIDSEWVEAAVLGLTTHFLNNSFQGAMNLRVTNMFNALVGFRTNSAYTAPVLTYGTIIDPSVSISIDPESSNFPGMITKLFGQDSQTGGGFSVNGIGSNYTSFNGDRYIGIPLDMGGNSFANGALFNVFVNGLNDPPRAPSILFERCLLTNFGSFNMYTEAGTAHFVDCEIEAFLGIVNTNNPLDAIFENCSFAPASGFGVPAAGAIQQFRNITLKNCSYIGPNPGSVEPYFACTGTLIYDTLTKNSFAANSQNIGSGTEGTSPSVTANTPVSGTVYQNTANIAITVRIPVTFSPTSTAAATLAVAVGASSTPSTITTDSEPAGLTAGSVRSIEFKVPAGFYWSMTATNATIGTGVIIA